MPSRSRRARRGGRRRRPGTSRREPELSTALHERAPSTAPAPAATTARRQEVEGLRTVAVALVVVYHVWVGGVSGGVDVFLALTGYFLMSSVLRRLRARTMTPRAVLEAWSRFLVRVLPAIALAVAGALLTVWVLLPATRWRDAARDALASLGVVENVRLGDQAVDYLARGDGTSPFQHLWSTSVQAQVTLLLPVLGLLVAVVAPRVRVRPDRLLVLATAVLTAASLARSVQLTAVDQPAAYFAGSARAWGLGAGALAAALLARWCPGAAAPSSSGGPGWPGWSSPGCCCHRPRSPGRSRRCRCSRASRCSPPPTAGDPPAPTACSRPACSCGPPRSPSRCTCGTGRCSSATSTSRAGRRPHRSQARWWRARPSSSPCWRTRSSSGASSPPSAAGAPSWRRSSPSPPPSPGRRRSGTRGWGAGSRRRSPRTAGRALGPRAVVPAADAAPVPDPADLWAGWRPPLVPGGGGRRVRPLRRPPRDRAVDGVDGAPGARGPGGRHRLVRRRGGSGSAQPPVYCGSSPIEE